MRESSFCFLVCSTVIRSVAEHLPWEQPQACVRDSLLMQSLCKRRASLWMEKVNKINRFSKNKWFAPAATQYNLVRSSENRYIVASHGEHSKMERKCHIHSEWRTEAKPSCYTSHSPAREEQNSFGLSPPLPFIPLFVLLHILSFTPTAPLYWTTHQAPLLQPSSTISQNCSSCMKTC